MPEKIHTTAADLLETLNLNSNPINLIGMSRFGIQAKNGLGCSMPFLRNLARQIRKDHSLALELWETEVHDARILASLLDLPLEVTQDQLIGWTYDFYSWDICDQVIGNLFRHVPFFPNLIPGFCAANEEFVRRAGFAGMAVLAIHEKSWKPEKFEPWFPLLDVGLSDERNFVKKAVSWALRQVGKRNSDMKNRVLEEIQEWEKYPLNGSAKWILRDVRQELAKS